MNDNPRTPTPWSWSRFAMVAGFAAVATASLLAPVSWSAYWRYTLLRYGWQMVAAILTAAVALLCALLVTGRRRESGVLALGMLFSIVVHMLMASFFGGMVLSHEGAVPAGGEKRLDVSTGVPKLTESLLSEEMRGEFTAVPQPDLRDLEVARSGQAEAAPARMERPDVKPATPVDRAPVAGREQAVQASAGKAHVEDSLATAGGKLPDIGKPDVVKLAQVRPAGEASATQPLSRNLPETMPLRLASEELAASRQTPGAPMAEDRQRAPERTATEISGVRHARQQADDIGAAPSQREKIAALPFEATQVRTESGAGGASATSLKRESRTLEIQRSSLSVPDAPVAAARIRRGWKSASASASADSLSDEVVSREAVRPRVDATASLRGAGHSPAEEQAVRIPGAFQSVEAQVAPSAGAGKPSTFQREIGAGKSGGGINLAEGVPSPSKAVMRLEGQVVTEKTLAGTLSGGDARGPAGNPTVQDRLLASGQRSVDRTSMVAGGRAERTGTVQEPAGMAAKIADGSHARGIAVARRENTHELMAGDGGGALSAPYFDLASAGSGAATPGQGASVDVAGIQAAFVPAPEEGAIAAASSPGGAAGWALTDIGGGAAQAVSSAPAPVPTPGGGSTGTVRRVSAGAWREWQAAGRKTDGGWNREGGPGTAPKRNVQEDLRAAGEAGGSPAGGATEAIPGGWAGVASAPDERTLPAGASRSAGVGAGRGDFAAGAVEGIARTGMESGSPGGGTREAEGAIGIHLEKAGPDLNPASAGEGVATRLSALDVAQGKVQGRQSRGASLADGQEVGIGRRGADGAGVAPESVLRGGTAGSGRGMSKVAFGTAVLEEGKETGGTGGEETVRGTRSGGEILVAKASGQVIPAGMPAGGSWLDVGSASLSASGSKSHGRLEGGTAGSGAQQGGVLFSRGGKGWETRRLLLADELAAIPKVVAQKAIYTLRTPERRKEVAREFGGSDKTEQAVEAALKWLANAQSGDGRWDVDGFPTLSRCGGPGDRSDEDVALTGLCLLSYLGAGYTHAKGEHKETVRKALNWLIEGQKADGDLQREGQMYGQAMAAAALCECYSMTGDKRLLEPIEKAVDFIARAQNPNAGWRYEPRKDSDTSVTGWQVLALKSGMIAGVRIPPEHFQWVEEWLGAVRRGREGGLYAYMPGQGATPTMTAEGWFCQLMMQEKTRMRGQGETIPYLMEHLPAWSSKENGVNLYFWYYSTLALYMSGAPEFAVWNKALVEALLAGQVKRGAAQGSWDPVCVLGARGGRIYMTATAALCLEVYYRYLPFYKQR